MNIFLAIIVLVVAYFIGESNWGIFAKLFVGFGFLGLMILIYDSWLRTH